MDYFDLHSLQLIVQKGNHFYSLPWCASDVQKRKTKQNRDKKQKESLKINRMHHYVSFILQLKFL